MPKVTSELLIDNNDNPIGSVLPVASGTGKTLVTGASSAQVALPAGSLVTFQAVTTVCHVKLGTGTPTATTSDGGWDFYLAIGQERTIAVGTATNVAAISTGAGALKMWGNG
ncbi:MAG: hypothetical protein K0S98_2209 [Propionibacteriaceae bacterium]|jgi:hypothetical protein|nr:hypothetical protein [Propionibacteriaceae bacterium]